MRRKANIVMELILEMSMTVDGITLDVISTHSWDRIGYGSFQYSSAANPSFKEDFVSFGDLTNDGSILPVLMVVECFENFFCIIVADTEDYLALAGHIKVIEPQHFAGSRYFSFDRHFLFIDLDTSF